MLSRTMLLIVVFLFAGKHALAEDLQALIQKAGNAATDEARMLVLEEILALPKLEENHRQEARRLRSEIERYLTDENLTYFGHKVYKTDEYDFGVAKDSPLYALTHLYRARMLIWVTMEYGGYWSDAQKRRDRLDMVRKVFEQANKLFPNEPLAKMYLGQPFEAEYEFDKDSQAPRWASAQREGLERLADVIHWWIDHRLRDDGQYGGGWGDDCEMWRWWIPLVIGFDDPKISEAQQKFSNALLGQEHMQGGYTSRMSDVEHTAEDSADAMTPMLHLEPDSQLWQQRALQLVELMKMRWTGINDRGELQFKSTYFTVDKVDDSAKRACDTVYHPRALQPALLLWQRTNHPEITRLFARWMQTWIRAAASDDRGKPAGVIPTAIHWPDGNIGGLGEHWWDPENHSEDPLYVFPSAMSQMTHTLLLAYHVTGDEQYLAPIRSMAALRMKHRGEIDNDSLLAGSAAWCAAKMGTLSSVLAKYRLLTGSKEFDDLLSKDASTYVRYRFWGEEEDFVAGLEKTAKALRLNFVGYTSEVRYTDRVLRLPWLFGENGIYEEAVEGIEVPDPGLLYASATGDPGWAGYFPMNAVKWLTEPRDLAALVIDSGTDRFEAKLYHFGNQPRTMGAELYLLKPGRYEVEVEGKQTKIEVTGPRTRIDFEVPPRIETYLRVQPDQEK